MESPELLNGIVKYIDFMYHPEKIIIDKRNVWDEPNLYHDEVTITLYFNDISDDYISNPQHRNINFLKEKNLELGELLQTPKYKILKKLIMQDI